MLDIERFKDINNTYGYQCEDFILKSLSSRALSLIKNLDYLVRYGGEEFCCLLSETVIADAIRVAKRFKTAIEQLENNFDCNIIKVTISLGISEFRPEIESAYMMIKKADEALYRVKREGRNRVAAIHWNSLFFFIFSYYY